MNISDKLWQDYKQAVQLVSMPLQAHQTMMMLIQQIENNQDKPNADE